MSDRFVTIKVVQNDGKGLGKDFRKLKDYVRSLMIDSQPGWTEVKGGSFGYFSARNAADAERAYEALRLYGFEGKSLEVHLFDTSQASAPRIACNCPYLYGTPGHSEPHFGYADNIARQLLAGQPLPLTPQQPAAVVSYQASQQSVMTPTYYQSGQMAVAVPGQYMYYSMPVAAPLPTAHSYGRNQAGLLTYTGNDTVPLEYRRIHISNVPYKLTKRELDKLVYSSSNPQCAQATGLHVDVSKDKVNFAWAEYRTPAEAQGAVTALNGKTLKGRQIRVKIDNDGTTVAREPGTANPVIACGATSQNRL